MTERSAGVTLGRVARVALPTAIEADYSVNAGSVFSGIVSMWVLRGWLALNLHRSHKLRDFDVFIPSAFQGWLRSAVAIAPSPAHNLPDLSLTGLRNNMALHLL
jgi:hypothetical protein